MSGVLVFFCGIANILYSQSYPYKNYTIKDGLPSNNIYSIKQDKRGYLWMNTDNGVAKFDGRNFKTFTVNDGLLSNDNFSMLFDSKENKWLYSFKSISRIDNNEEIRTYDYTNSHFSFFMIDSDDNLYYLKKDDDKNINTKSIIFSSISKDTVNNFKHSSFNKDYIHSKMYFYIWNNNVYFIAFDLKSGIILDSLKWDKKAKRFLNNDVSESPKVPLFGKFIKHPELIQFGNNFTLIFNAQEYTLTKGNKVIKTSKFPDNSTKFTIGDTYLDNDDLYIVLQSGVYKYSVGNDLSDKWEYVFKYPKITGVLRDKEGNFWVSTIGEGLYKFFGYSKVQGLEQVKYLSKDNVIKVNGIGGRKIWCVNSNNILTSLHSKNQFNGEILKDVRFLMPYKNFVLFGGNNALYFNDKLIGEFAFKDICSYNDTLVYAGSFGLNFFNNTSLNKFSSELSLKQVDITGRMYAVYYEKGLFYSGNQQGLYWGRPNRDELNPICLDPNEESVSVNGIKKSSDGLIWVSTDGRGVYVVRDKEPVRHFQKELLDGNINSMRIDEQDQVWLATRYGVNRISRNAHGEYQVSKYTSFHGLPSDFVNDTYCYNDTLYVATDAGLVRMDIAEIDRIDFSQPPPVYINKVICTAGSRPFMLKADSSYVLHHDQNFIKIEYSGISYRSNGNITYAYRLLPLISDWRYTGSDLIEFNDLNAGEYTFEVKAINSIGTVSSTPARYSFAIKPHFTRTLWFLTLCGIAITGLIYLAIYYYFDYIRRRNIEKAKIERQLSQLKLQSLQAQLNPHFIFNSLNAVQQLVNDEDLDQANIYLARFAKLMRLYLEGSDNQFITLKQELEVLKLYIQLEHLRFKDKFVYNITISGDVNLDNYQVPAMLLQPHVENAIRHGLSRDTRPGRELNIIVKKQGEEVVVIINDNGIGRVKSLEQKRAGEPGHKSMGNKISKQRIELIRALKLGNIREYIIDLEDNEGIANGTSVEIYISEKPTETITDET